MALGSPSLEEFAEYIGLDLSNEETDKTDARNALAVGIDLVEQALEGQFRPIPANVYDQCVRDVALAIYQRTSNNGGQYSSESPAGPIDPLMRVRPMLRMYVMSL